jgi:hypothetical protein
MFRNRPFQAATPARRPVRRPCRVAHPRRACGARYYRPRSVPLPAGGRRLALLSCRRSLPPPPAPNSQTQTPTPKHPLSKTHSPRPNPKHPIPNTQSQTPPPNAAKQRRDAFTMNMLEIPQGAGSGFVWDDKGHVVSAASRRLHFASQPGRGRPKRTAGSQAVIYWLGAGALALRRRGPRRPAGPMPTLTGRHRNCSPIH